jgi:hypothetical protein
VTEPAAYTAEHIRTAVEQPPVAELGLEICIDADGRVHLSGIVPSEEQRAAVLSAVRGVDPDVTVVDGLAVSHRPPDGVVEQLS